MEGRRAGHARQREAACGAGSADPRGWSCGVDRPARRCPLGGAAAANRRYITAELRLATTEVARHRDAPDEAVRLPAGNPAGADRRRTLPPSLRRCEDGCRGGAVGEVDRGTRDVAWSAARGLPFRVVRAGGDRSPRSAPPLCAGGEDRGRSGSRTPHTARRRTRAPHSRQSAPGAPARPVDARSLPLRPAGRGATGLSRRTA